MFPCIKAVVLVILLLLINLTFNPYALNQAHADELAELQKQIDELSKSLELSKAATKPLEGQLDALKRQLAQIQAKLDNLSLNISQKEKELKLREEKLVSQQVLLNLRVRSYYIRSYYSVPFLVILASATSGDLFRELTYRQAATKEDQRIITTITQQMLELLTEKDRLEKDKVNLSNLQAQVDKNAQFLGSEVKKAKQHQAQLQSKIAQLTLRQQQIIAQRQASLNLPTTLGAGPLFCTDDRKIDPGFSPGFAFFTYGIPHRVGMNQYGAYGRAKAGQNYKDILLAYFNGVSFEKRPNTNIKVAGFGEMPLEKYLLGIYEMPDSFPTESLKAQAVAARSYALAYTGNGAKEICTTQACQVYKGGNKGGNWEQAVKSTEGEVLVHSGQVISAWYASTAGGYMFRSEDVGWGGRPWTKRLRDTSGEVASFGDLLEKGYDKDSPCFYAAQGLRASYNKSAWLKSDEVADIVNVILLNQKDSALSGHLYQIDKPNPEGKENWDFEKVKSELKLKGGAPLNSVSGVSVSWDGSTGITTAVNILGDTTSYTFSGTDFKNFFNLRAPANLQIVGPLFNVEKR